MEKSISKTMSFKVHLEHLKVKVMKVVGQMRRVLKSEWCIRKRAVRIIYKGVCCLCDVWRECMV